MLAHHAAESRRMRRYPSSLPCAAALTKLRQAFYVKRPPMQQNILTRPAAISVS